MELKMKRKKKRGTSYGWIIIELFDDLTANDVSTFCNVKKDYQTLDMRDYRHVMQ